MQLPPGQAELISAVVAANRRTVVVLNGGSPSVVSPWIDGAAGLVMYWYGGTEGGTALARVLFGDVNPSGKLPCTWPKVLADSPAHAGGEARAYPGVGARGRGVLTAEAGPQETYGEGIFVGYRWFDEKKIEPQFPFGFGLSYTTFELSGVRVREPELGAGGKPSLSDGGAVVDVEVTNTGPRAGTEVVQVYVEQVEKSVPRPVRELKGFDRVTLEKGQRRTATMMLDLSAFAFWDPSRKAWVAERGEYRMHVGPSSRNIVATVPFRLGKTVVVQEGGE
jgi:beta-glucosidase